MTADITIRPCRFEDIPAVLKLWIDADTVPGPTDHAAAIERRLQRDGELFVLAVDGARIVGSLMGGWNGWRGDMARLAVHPDYRRRGIARQLIAEVETRLRDLGCSRITSLVFINEPGAPELWSNAGYKPDSEIGRYYRDL
ncbi:MAG: GNAT family N-acetyltransferase [Dehalococcoidia bacterium]|jgi:ribosomal protein S18 acetylase RimI-like enzyme|nr:GNAT family N-acetyltransferase [Dehalococcoidia bacterium]